MYNIIIARGPENAESGNDPHARKRAVLPVRTSIHYYYYCYFYYERYCVIYRYCKGCGGKVLDFAKTPSSPTTAMAKRQVREFARARSIEQATRGYG